jgi:hypothetical protein
VGGEEGFATNVSRKELDMVKYIMDTCKCEWAHAGERDREKERERQREREREREREI